MTDNFNVTAMNGSHQRNRTLEKAKSNNICNFPAAHGQCCWSDVANIDVAQRNRQIGGKVNKFLKLNARDFAINFLSFSVESLKGPMIIMIYLCENEKCFFFFLEDDEEQI